MLLDGMRLYCLCFASIIVTKLYEYALHAVCSSCNDQPQCLGHSLSAVARVVPRVDPIRPQVRVANERRDLTTPQTRLDMHYVSHARRTRARGRHGAAVT